jgi:hypothetical protein
VAGQRRGRWDGKPVRNRFRDALSEIDWRDFERLLADYYRDQGYEVQQTGTGKVSSAFDGGVDLRLWKDGRLTLVQCKRENAYQVTHNVVHELLGIKINQGAIEAIVITTGEFTEAAKKAGANGLVRLIDGVEVRGLLGARLADIPVRSNARQSDFEPTWEPLYIAEEPRFRKRDRSGKKRASEGEKVAAAIIGLILLALLQTCAGSHGTASSGAPQSAPSATPVSPTIKPDLAGASSRTDERYQPTPPSQRAAPAFAETTLAESRPISAAEQAKLDEETRRYLERIPEVTHYRYSPLDQNREPTSTLSDLQQKTSQ